MIKFHDLPTDEAAHTQIVEDLMLFGTDRAEAERLADAACSIVLSMLRGLDAKVCEAVSDELDRTIVQQIVMHQLHGITDKALSVNAVQMGLQLLRKLSGL